MTQFPAPAGTRITTALFNHAYSLSDANITTVTGAAGTTPVELSSVYQIPAADAAVGVAYELAAFGNGTTGSTAETLQFGLYLAGSIVGIAPTIGSSAFGTSLAFRWRVSLLLIPVTTGSTATWVGSLQGVVTEAPNNVLPTGSTQNSIAFAGGNSSAVTQDSTVANDLALYAAWGGNPATSPTITCIGTRFTRCG